MGEKQISRGFGARYGPRIRGKYAKIAKEQSSSYNCPYCNYTKAKRLAVGIWHCNKCNSRFTNKAYRVDKLSSIRNVIEEQILEKEIKKEVSQNE